MKDKRPQIIIGPVSTIEKMKKRAKRLVKSKGIKHHEALELVAQQFRLPNWKSFLDSVEPFQATEEAFRHGVVIAMDMKDGMDLLDSESQIFIEDQGIILLADQDKELRKVYKEVLRMDLEILEEKRKVEDFSVAEFNQEFLEFLEGMMFFRLDPKISAPKDVNEVIDLVKQHCFWVPSYVWIKGEFYERS